MRFLLFLILCPILLLASDNATASGENYIVRRDYLNAAGTEYVDVVEYFDGLGRSVETVQRGITPSGQSLVTVREYDSQSRLAREWQPVVSPNTDFKFDRGGEITYRNDGEGRRMEVTHRISSASASLAGKPVPSAAYKTVLKRKYIDHFVYRNDTLEYILTPTGYIDRDGNYYHYQKDSRGSVRTVLDGAGRVVERNDYYPYGMLMVGVSKSVQPYKFGGKELDRIGGINHYDFHARQLQLPIPHFYQQDPYADKYPHLSPYLYCAGNPLRYVDPSGKVLNFAEGTTPEFKINFYKALIFMSVRGTSDNILKIMLSPNVYYVADAIQNKTRNKFSGEERTIYWNPYFGIKTSNSKLLSPATMLDHEAQHCVNYDENKKKYIKDLNTKLDDTIYKDYHNEEDKNVIQKRERQTAIKHGEINSNEKTREDHFGEEFYTGNPINPYSPF